MGPKLLVIGAGGFGRAVAEAAAAAFDVVGFVDDRFPALNAVSGMRVLGRTADLQSIRSLAGCVIVAIGDNARREILARSAVQHGFDLATFVHPRGFVSPSAQIGAGSIVMAGCVIGSGSVLGEGVIAHYGSTIDHDCVIGSFSHIGVGACISGGVVLGQKVWLQAGCALGGAVQIDGGTVVSESVR